MIDDDESDELDENEDDAFAQSERKFDWRTTDPTDESVEHRVYISLGSIAQGSHLFDVQDNLALKDFLDGLLAYVDGILWQHAAIATDVEILAVIPRQLSTSDFAARMRIAVAKFLSCTRLAENELVLFRFAVREAHDLDSASFTRERERIQKLRTAYTRLCNMSVGGSDTIALPAAGRTRRKWRF